MAEHSAEVAAAPPTPPPPSTPPAGPPAGPPPILESATRSIPKATLVPLDVPAAQQGQAVVKAGFLRQLELRPGEADLARERAAAGDVDELVSLLRDADDADSAGGPALPILAQARRRANRRYSGAIVCCTSDVPPRASCHRVRIRRTLHARAMSSGGGSGLPWHESVFR